MAGDGTGQRRCRLTRPFALLCSALLRSALSARFDCAWPQNRIKDPKLIETWNTAAHYHLMHSVLLTVTPLLSGASHTYSTRLLSAGIVIFSGSLYALVLTGEKRLGALAPVGGTALIAGWSVTVDNTFAHFAVAVTR